MTVENGMVKIPERIWFTITAATVFFSGSVGALLVGYSWQSETGALEFEPALLFAILFVALIALVIPSVALGTAKWGESE